MRRWVSKLRKWWAGTEVPPRVEKSPGVVFFIGAEHHKPRLRVMIEASIAWLGRHRDELLVALIGGVILAACVRLIGLQ